MSKIFLHVGLHKTGTTFIQRNVFSNIKNINLFCTDGRRLNDAKDLEKDKISLISYESFSGNPFYSREYTRDEITKELAKKYPEAKIIVTFRKKEPWLKSLYSQYVKSGGTYSFTKWRNNFFNEKYLDFKGYEKLLRENFKEVLVLDFELLKSDIDSYIKKICDFIGVDVPEYDSKIVGKRLSDRQLKLLRILNYSPIKISTIYYFFDTRKTKKFFEKKVN